MIGIDSKTQVFFPLRFAKHEFCLGNRSKSIYINQIFKGFGVFRQQLTATDVHIFLQANFLGLRKQLIFLGRFADDVSVPA
jgi:hypothetical protein